MTESEAVQRILVHAGFVVAVGEEGIVSRVRPFRGVPDGVMVELLECLVVLHPRIHVAEAVDRRLCSALWEICQRVRMIALDPKNTVRKTHLISEADARRLEAQLDAFEIFCIRMLHGSKLMICMSRFVGCIVQGFLTAEKGNLEFIIPLLEEFEATEDIDPTYAEEAKAALTIIRKV